MSITDELRKEARGLGCYMYIATQAKQLIAIADHIDAEHEKAIHELNVLAEASVPLPKDADNVPWNLGERDEDGNEVIALKLAPDGWYVIAVGEWPYRPESKRHYHAPNVEDVLREFICDHEEGVRDEVDLIAEYAAKLRLAEEDA